MKPWNKKIIVLATLALRLVCSYILFYHFLRKPSQVVNGSATSYRTFTAHTAGIQAGEFGPRGETIASGSIDGTAKIWRRDDGRVILVWSMAEKNYRSVSSSQLLRRRFRLEKRRNSFCRLIRGNDRVNFELDQVIPIDHPFVEMLAFVSFHQLKATFELFIDPA